MADDIKATPVKSKGALELAKAVQKMHEFASKPFGYQNPPIELLSEFIGLPAISQTLERIGYGEPLTTGAGGLGGTSKPRPEVLEAGMAVAPLSKPALKGAKSVGKFAGKGAAEMIERGMFGEGPLASITPQVMNVVKPKGGNWLTGNVEKQVGRMKMADTIPPEKLAEDQKAIDTAKRIMGDDPTAQRAIQQMENEMAVNKRNNAINNWIDRNLTNYIKKEMGTPEDPVRKLAEEGILHIKPVGDQYEVSQRLMHKRKGAGFNPLGEGKSEPARFWERQADISIDPYPAGSYKHGTLDEGLLEANPWLKNVPDEEMISYAKGLNDLGFDHIVDVLRQDVREGRIRPEQLSKVSMEQAVRRTYEYDQEMAKKMREAQIKATEGMPVHKEYPEGYKWIELAPPKELPSGYSVVKDEMTGSFKVVDANGKEAVDYPANKLGHINVPFHRTEEEAIADALKYDKRLEEALKYEGETMGHCVGGYCPDVMEGRSRIYSLRDAKGEPHVTVEVRPPRVISQSEAADQARKEGLRGQEFAERVFDLMEGKNQPQRIAQIKGKQNRAPKEEYLPYVQDFVKGGQWSDVGDFENTGLIRRGNVFTPTEKQGLIDLGQDVPEYLTQEDIARLRRARGDLPPEEGMKRGGVVMSDNPDTMMLELQEGRNAGGAVNISDNPDAMMMGVEDQKFDKGGEVKATPRSEGWGKAADLVKAIEDASKEQFGYKNPATEEIAKFLMIPELSRTLERKAYGQPITNIGKANVPLIPEDTAGAIQAVMPLASPATKGAKSLGKAAASEVEKAMFGESKSGILNAMTPQVMSVYKPHTPLKPDPDVGTRYKVTDMGGLAPRQDLNIENLKDSQVKIFPWDATSRNKLVTEVSDIKLQNPVLTEGGDDYMRDLQHMKQRIAGASNEGIAKRIMDRTNEASVENQLLGDGTGRVFGFPVRMGAKAEYASTFPTDIMKDIMDQAGLKKTEKKALDESMRNMVFEGKKGVFKDMAPFGSKEFFEQLKNGLASDKEKKISGFTDMNMRKAFMDRMALVEQQKRLGYNIQDLTGSVLADELKGIPKGYVGNVAAELDVFGKLRPSKSSTYSHDFPGVYAGSMPNMPVEILMPKTFENIYREMKAEYPNASKEALRNMAIGAMEKRKNKISEKITQRNIDAVKTYQEGLMKGEFDPNNIQEVYDFMLRKKLQLKMANGGKVDKADNGLIRVKNKRKAKA